MYLIFILNCLSITSVINIVIISLIRSGNIVFAKDFTMWNFENEAYVKVNWFNNNMD